MVTIAQVVWELAFIDGKSRSRLRSFAQRFSWPVFRHWKDAFRKSVNFAQSTAAAVFQKVRQFEVDFSPSLIFEAKSLRSLQSFE